MTRAKVLLLIFSALIASTLSGCGMQRGDGPEFTQLIKPTANQSMVYLYRCQPAHAGSYDISLDGKPITHLKPVSYYSMPVEAKNHWLSLKTNPGLDYYFSTKAGKNQFYRICETKSGLRAVVAVPVYYANIPILNTLYKPNIHRVSKATALKEMAHLPLALNNPKKRKRMRSL